MGATVEATTAVTPAAWRERGGCRRGEPQPKLRPATDTSPSATPAVKSGRCSQRQWRARCVTTRARRPLAATARTAAMVCGETHGEGINQVLILLRSILFWSILSVLS